MTRTDTILGKPYVVHPDADRVYYGDFGVSVCRSRTPLYIQTLLELYAQEGLIGVSSYQFADWKFFAPPSLPAGCVRQPGREGLVVFPLALASGVPRGKRLERPVASRFANALQTGKPLSWGDG